MANAAQRRARGEPAAAFRAANAGQVALSYSKFDHIVDSDDEDNESKARPLLIDKQRHLERDAELTQRFTAHLREHLKSKYPVAHRKLVARFIAISDRGAERSNVYRYSDMTH